MDSFGGDFTNIFRKHDEIINLEQPQSFFGNITRAYAYQVNCKPLSLGIIADPPTLVLFYESGEGVGNEKRKRKMPLRKFNEKSNVEHFGNEIKLRHGGYLENVPNTLIEKLLRIIQEIQKGEIPGDAVTKVNQEFHIDPEEDLNKLSIKELEKKKNIMEESFLKNIVKPDDPEFVYDKQVEFFNDENKVKSEWDEEDLAPETPEVKISPEENKIDQSQPVEPKLDNELDKIFDDEFEEEKDEEELNIAIHVEVPDKKYEDDFDDFW